MIDINIIRNNPDVIREAIRKRNKDPSIIEKIVQLDGQRRTLILEIENLRAQRNKLTKDQADLGRNIKKQLQDLEPKLKGLDDALQGAMYQIPNIPLAEVPEGKDELDNVVVRQCGSPRHFSFLPKDHLELGEGLGILNIEAASRVVGARFGYLMGDLALMEIALISYSLKKISEKGFSPVIPPVMISPDVYMRMARLDPGQEDERYYLPKDDLYLIGSAEHTLGPLHIDQILDESMLPIRYVGFSTCFRREAGSYGKDTRGILRVHQFDKVEMECFSLPEDGLKEQDLLVSIQEEMMQELQLPYMVVSVCTGDMGGPDARQIDIETWMPSQNKYRETHSADYMTDYQSRRLNTRVKRKNGTTEFVHMNDATAIAIGRTLIAIMENYQNEDGSINVPDVLKPYLQKDRVTRANS